MLPGLWTIITETINYNKKIKQNKKTLAKGGKEDTEPIDELTWTGIEPWGEGEGGT
jgi:hypothetical protein